MLPRNVLYRFSRCRVRAAATLAVPAALLALLALLALGGCERASRPVVFGLAGPFSLNYGESSQRGALLALKEVNETGGIRGRPLELRALDDAASPERAIAVAERFFADPEIIAVVGHVNSGAMIEAGAIYGRGLPAVATSATSPFISRLGPWVFRIASSDSINAVRLAERVYRQGLRTGLLYQNHGYGRGLAESFERALQARGGTLLEASPYLGSTEDFTPYLERMRRQNVQLIFIAGMGDIAAEIIRQARAIAMEAEFIGGDGLEGLVTMGPLFDGTRVGLLFHTQQSAEAQAFAGRFRSEYGREPDSFAALAYDAVHLLARAAADGGRSRAAIRAYLEGVGRPEGRPAFAGATGLLRFDENGDPIGKEVAIGTIRDGGIALEDGGP